MVKKQNTVRGGGNSSKNRLYSRITLSILSIFIVAVSAIMIWTAASLQSAIDRRTENYISDVSLQLASDIDFRLSNITIDLEMMTDSLFRYYNNGDIDGLKQYLERKTQYLDFTAIAIMDKDGNLFCTESLNYDFISASGVKNSFQGKNSVSFLDRQSILYSIPIYRDGSIVGVIGGVRNKENMQKLIQPQSFSGEGLTCIIDLQGEVIISPTNLEPFLQLDNIFLKDANDKVVEDIHIMQEEIQKHIGGIFSFTAVDGTDLVLSYDPLNSYDWVLLTLVPADLISYETNRYIAQSFLIIAVIIVLFIAILVAFYRMHRNHYKQLENIAFVDRITKGMNNAAFQLSCQKLFQKTSADNYAIAALNIKDFKLINENFGSIEGNKTLHYMMQILEQSISQNEIAARAEADNFFLCLKETDKDIILRRIQTIIREINQFKHHLQEPYNLIIQSGIYIIDEPDTEITIMQDRAKTACRNRSTYEDGVCLFYDSAITRQLQNEHELNDLFESSLINGKFQIYLQPKVGLVSRQAEGAEALIRWNHPQKGMIYPSDFIPIFENNGKICRLDLYVFEEVCKLLHHWLSIGLKPIPISVNVSRHHFKNPRFLNDFQKIIDKYDVPPQLIEMELTESIFFDDQVIEHVKEQIKNIHALGFSCSLDDFGAGFSSLGLLMKFDVDVIKLDRRFFTDVKTPKAQKVIASIIELSNKIGAKTVAEGIETPEQLDLLNRVNCDMVQGYIFSKPLPIPEFEKWLNQEQD